MSTPLFISPLAADLRAYLAFRESIGRHYLWPPSRLQRFDRFVAERCKRRPVDLKKLVCDWLARPGKRAASTMQGDLAYVRGFCLFLRRSDPATYVPGPDRVPPYRRRFNAYVFTLDEVERLLRAASDAQEIPRWPGYRALFLRTLLLVLYCTGLRPGEALRLHVDDVDLRERVFFIRDSKRKSRWVPFDVSLARHLVRYFEYRKRIAPTEPGTTFFLPVQNQLNGRKAREWFHRLLRRAGIAPAGRPGPRLYDLRHTFAVHRLTRWYHEGADFADRLPWLSTYMGHRDLLGTEVYLKATPELLELASQRFARRFRRKERS